MLEVTCHMMTRIETATTLMYVQFGSSQRTCVQLHNTCQFNINYSLNNQNNILCYRRFDFTSEVFIRTDFQYSGRQYVRACPIRGSTGNSPRLDSCFRSSWSISPVPDLSDSWSVTFALSQSITWIETRGATSWATYGTNSYILTTATGSQSWWRLPTWSRNVDNKVCYFGCLESN